MLVIGVAGTELTAQERDWLQHDAVSGVILFKRNFASRQQVADLSAAIRAAAPRPVLVCVDQEGGRVQRFREGFSALPPLQGFDALYAQDPDAALALAEQHAWLMASEVRASGVDLSFAPVVDLGRGNRAIGDRAFSADPQVVAAFTRAYVRGMHSVGRQPRSSISPATAACWKTPTWRPPATRVRLTNCARWTCCRSRPASMPAPMP
jgi:beta-N-acetylhexosaminidase